VALWAIRNPRAAELTVWYVHGWNHTAAKGDSDLVQFKKLVRRLSKRQSLLPGHQRRHVVGIYVGWAGAVLPRRWNLLTFWNRKRAADSISQSAVVTKIFAAARCARGQNAHPDDLQIFIGHSFGARIVFTATSQVLIDDVQRNHPGKHLGSYGVLKGPADLILLLNPAFEASMFTVLKAMQRSESWEKIHEVQQPLLLTISTANDFATTRLFPWGQWLAFTKHERRRKTLGNFEQYVSHDLVAGESTSHPTFWYDDFSVGGLVIRRRKYGPDVHDGNPFIVARTTPEIINGHNGIWKPALTEWIIAVVLELHRQRISRSAKAA
jgi:hypothetical protein